MRARECFAVALPAVLGACSGAQSALAPAGREAVVLLDMFHVLAIGAVVIWLALNGLVLWFSRVRLSPVGRRRAEALILGGGIVFPTLALGALLLWSLPVLADLRRPGGAPEVRIRGEEWWWRVNYVTPDGLVASANELRLPAGEATEISLDADRVIHSFWVPSLSGKLDMFPGRETRLALEPLRPGVFRGQCAELCGDQHAQMAFATVVMEPAAFRTWLVAQARPAAEPAGDKARRGEAIFLAEGCGACHTVRGTPANGRLGPDLTHVGSRTTIAAGTLPATLDGFRTWILHTQEVKPGVMMPQYGHLSVDDADALATYLEGLE